MQIPIEVSARHIHLSLADLACLFGSGYELQVKRYLSQEGEFAAEETVRLAGKKGELMARIIGPLRPRTQVELSLSDARTLGIETCLRLSGDLDGSAGMRLIGPSGECMIAEGVIIAQRHLHISSAEAARLGIADSQSVKLRIAGERGGILDNIIVRTSERFRTAVHIDTDEGNAFGISADNAVGELLID